jgi:hypothetical protein
MPQSSPPAIINEIPEAESLSGRNRGVNQKEISGIQVSLSRTVIGERGRIVGGGNANSICGVDRRSSPALATHGASTRAAGVALACIRSVGASIIQGLANIELEVILVVISVNTVHRETA